MTERYQGGGIGRMQDECTVANIGHTDVLNPGFLAPLREGEVDLGQMPGAVQQFGDGARLTTQPMPQGLGVLRNTVGHRWTL